MKIAEQKLIESCAVRGVELDEVDAGFVLLAQKILTRDPKNEDAKKVMENFAQQLKTGKAPWSFAGFALRAPVSEETDAEC
jgi:hypothetical protein